MFWEKLQKIAFWIFICLVAVSLLSYYLFGQELNLDQFRDYIKSFGIIAPLVFLAIYTLGTIFIPSTPFMVIAGILFGFNYGLIYSLIGGVVSALLTFYVARFFGREKTESLLRNRYLQILQKYNKRLEHGAIFDIIIMRITPFIPFNVLNIVLGVSKTKTKDYLIGTIFGLLPSIAITVYLSTLVIGIF